MSDKTPEQKLAKRIARWENYGVEAIKSDLLMAGGHKLVGGGPEVRKQAWDWVREQEAARDRVKLGDAVEAKAGVFGFSFDLKKGFRWCRYQWRRFRGR